MSHGWRFVVVLFASIAVAVTGAFRAVNTARAEDEIKQSSLPAAAVAPVGPETASPETPVPPEKYKLTFKFRPNQIVHQEISHEFQLTTNKNQDSETVHNSSKSKRHYRVATVDDKTGVADLEMVIDWVHMLASFDKNDGSTTEPIEFQSDDPKKHPKKFDQILASIGKRAWLRFSPLGAPVKAPSGKSPGGTAPRSDRVTSTVTDGTLEAYLFPLPEHAVAVGETWKEPFDVRVKDDEQNLVRIRLQRTYKLAKIKNGRAVIEYRTFILTPIQVPSVAAQFIERESTGTIEFDLEQGMIVSREWSVDKTIVNPVGANSSMRVKSRYREKLLGSEATGDHPGKIVPASTNPR